MSRATGARPSAPDLAPSAPDLDEIIAGLLAFVDRFVMPLQGELAPFFDDGRRFFDERGVEAAEVREARRRVRTASAEAGYYSMFVPEALGGAGLGAVAYFRCVEALSARYGPGEPAEPLTANVLANWFAGPGHIWAHAGTALREEWYERVLSGGVHGTFGLSEPNAGSDVWGIRTLAERQGDGWVINGQKQWASWSAGADYVLLFAVTDLNEVKARRGGITCFFVPTSTPGYSFDGPIRILGDVGGREAIISFSDVRVPDAHRIGDEGDGLAVAFSTLTWTRLWLAARSCGESLWATRKAHAYAAERETFGAPILHHQSVANLLADMAADTFSARAVGMECARRADLGGDVRFETAVAKLFCVNAACRVFDNAIQVHGGMGLTNELRLFDGWKTARMSRITEGTDEIMRRTISRSLAAALQQSPFSL